MKLFNLTIIAAFFGLSGLLAQGPYRIDNTTIACTPTACPVDFRKVVPPLGTDTIIATIRATCSTYPPGSSPYKLAQVGPYSRGCRFPVGLLTTTDSFLNSTVIDDQIRADGYVMDAFFFTTLFHSYQIRDCGNYTLESGGREKCEEN